MIAWSLSPVEWVKWLVCPARLPWQPLVGATMIWCRLQQRTASNSKRDTPSQPNVRALVTVIIYFKMFFKVGAKIAKIALPNFFFDPPKNKKTLCPKSFAIGDLWRHLTFKIDLHSPDTPKPSKNAFLLQQGWLLEGFGVPGGCKSILNVVINPI